MKILIITVAALLVIVLGGLGYLGVFSPVDVEERDAGPYHFVYVQEASSDFGKIGQLTESLGQRLEQAGFKNRRPAQIYYPTGRGIQNQIGFVVDRPVGREVLGAETFFRPIPAQRYMMARYPFRNPLSFMLGYFRVDPVFKEYRQVKGYPATSAIVILDGNTITYLQPIEQG